MLLLLFMWRAANSCRCESSLTRLKSDSNPWMMDNVVYFTETKGSRFALCNDDAKGSLKLDGYGGTDTQPQPMVSMLLILHALIESITECQALQAARQRHMLQAFAIVRKRNLPYDARIGIICTVVMRIRPYVDV